MSFDDDDFFEDADSPADDAQDAIDLVTAVRDALIAAAVSSGGGDDARYYTNHCQLRAVVRRLGVRNPFPWPTLREGVEAAKTEHGTYAGRRAFLKERAETALDTLRRRVADNESGNLAAAVGQLRTAAVDALGDVPSLRAELARIEAALPEDPSVAIGKAKNLVEAVAKAILLELGLPADDKTDVGPLAVAAARALGLTHDGPPADREAAKVVSRVGGIVEAVANLRNRAGDGHGVTALPADLDRRHGRLAVRAAITWCTFMLDTLDDQRSSSQRAFP
jgi:hypothetical protein